MADIHGFMKYDRKENQKISPIKRVVDFSEFFDEVVHTTV